MDERAALSRIADRLPAAGDDAAVVDGHVLTTDMLHETTDFPDGVTRYTAGWRAVGASLSDVAAMGARAVAAVAVYAAPAFEPDELDAFVDGAVAVCGAVDAEYVGGDLDDTDEFTVATTALGEAADPVRRSGAAPGEAVCVTGALGRSAAALRCFESGDVERANELFRFEPRVAAGRTIGKHATALMDSSDGLARSCHQLAEASDCGIALDGAIPYDDALEAVLTDAAEIEECGVFFGEDFELVFTVAPDDLVTVKTETAVDVTRIGTTTEQGVTWDGDPLPDRGYTH
jgi:thiamine-monophosphate kinase